MTRPASCKSRAHSSLRCPRAPASRPRPPVLPGPAARRGWGSRVVSPSSQCWLTEPLTRRLAAGGLPELQFLVLLIYKSSLGASVRGGPALKVVQVSGLVRSVHALQGDSPEMCGNGQGAVAILPPTVEGVCSGLIARTVNLYHLRLKT